MRKSYIDIIIDFQKESIKNSQETGFKIASEFFEKAIVWIIGLSSGTILLIFSELNKERKIPSTLLDPFTIKWTLIFLIASIVLGILGIILYAIAIYIGYGTFSKFSLLINTIGFQRNSRELSGDETSEYIYLLLLEDFNIDLPIIIENKKNASLEKKGSEDANARKLYLDYSELAISKQSSGLNSSNKLAESIFMIKKNRSCKIKFIRRLIIGLKRYFFLTKGVIWRSFTWLSFSLYILSALSFLAAIIFYVIRYYSFACSA